MRFKYLITTIIMFSFTFLLMAQVKEKGIVWKKDCDDFGKCQMVFKEEFLNNENGWPLENDPKKGLAELVTGQGLKLKTNKKISVAQWIKIDIEKDEDYTVETNILFKTGSENAGYGIIWGFKDWDNYQYFLINNTGSFTYGRKIEGLNVDNNKWYYTSKINTEKLTSNRLQVTKKGDKVYLAVNGVILESFEGLNLVGKGFGLLLDNDKAEINVKNFFIKKSDGEKETAFSEKGDDGKYKSSGSGFVVSASANLIVTNYHVIKDSKEGILVDVYLPSGKKSFVAKELSSDKTNDLSLLKLEEANLQNELGDVPFAITSKSANVGTSVFTLGYPLAQALGKEVKFTDGKISSKTGYQGDFCCYQISVPVQPGNSGGPLFDEVGGLIGVINAKVTNAENVSYAIKSSYLLNLLDAASIEIKEVDSSKLATSTDKVKELSKFTVFIKVK